MTKICLIMISHNFFGTPSIFYKDFIVYKSIKETCCFQRHPASNPTLRKVFIIREVEHRFKIVVHQELG